GTGNGSRRETDELRAETTEYSGRDTGPGEIRLNHLLRRLLMSPPKAVQEKILKICSDNLTPDGIGYVSYNTYPGWHMRGMIRDMMRYHALRFATPNQRTEQARALLDFLATSVRQEGPYSVLLKSELEGLRHQADHYLYHEHLEDVNDPLYFHQFVDMATKHGLRYLGESRIGTMVTGNFAPEVEKTLK